MEQHNNCEFEESFELIRKEAHKRHGILKEQQTMRIYIGKATCGLASGALDTQKAFEKALNEHNLEVDIRSTGCLGHCYAEPVVIIDNPESGWSARARL